MKTFELTDDEYKTLQEIFYDHGSDCPSTCSEDYQTLGEKLGILEPIPEPTEEELKRREEFKNSEFGQLMSKMLSDCNSQMSKMAAEVMKDNAFIQWGSKNLPLGAKISVRLPNNYINKVIG